MLCEAWEKASRGVIVNVVAKIAKIAKLQLKVNLWTARNFELCTDCFGCDYLQGSNTTENGGQTGCC